MSERLFLLDGMALAYRAYFAFITNPLRNSKGENTSAVYGFTTALIKILEEENRNTLLLFLTHPNRLFGIKNSQLTRQLGKKCPKTCRLNFRW